MSKEKVFCYFHNDDNDGWASSAVVKMKYPQAEFYGYNYEPDLPLVEGYDKVFMVDCSTTLDNIKYLQKHNKQFILIDHHARKVKALYESGIKIEGLRDMNLRYCGCVLTWKYIYPEDEIPELLLYVQDMDLWKWELEFTDEINTALFCLHKNRDEIIMILKSTGWKPSLLGEGTLLIKQRTNEVNFLASTLRKKMFHGYKTAIVNSPVNTSFVGHKVLEDNPDVDIALIWYATKDLIKVSLRSREVDVSAIAKQYDGGGHKLASGFNMVIGADKFYIDKIIMDD